MVAPVSPVVTIEVTLWVYIPGQSPCVALESAFEATYPQAPFYHPLASALTTSLSRTLTEVSGLALSLLSALGTTWHREKENSPGSHWSCLFQMSNWAKNKCILGRRGFWTQPVWVPHWTQLGTNHHWLDTEGLVVCLLCSACLSGLDFLLTLSRDLSRGAEATNSKSNKPFCTGLQNGHTGCLVWGGGADVA